MRLIDAASCQRLGWFLVLSLAAFFANLRAMISWDLHPRTESIFDQAWNEVVGWVLVTLLVLWLLIRHGTLSRQLGDWRRQPWLLAFLALCTL